jgi:peptidoglycan hydrolase CwlO-like protein
MQTETIISLLIALAALIFTALSFRRNINQDNSATAMDRATMTADIRYIRSSIDEIKLENRAIQKDVTEMKAKIAEVEASVKSAHRRLDDWRKEHEA